MNQLWDIYMIAMSNISYGPLPLLLHQFFGSLVTCLLPATLTVTTFAQVLLFLTVILSLI
jgi:hypothetical protein